jgi:L,D-peptidoglycan transpeptidase YkuD (ErfK/YbiS/YcfS/YnhG family)
VAALAAASAAAAPAPASTRAACPSSLAAQLASTRSASQLVTVAAAATASTTGTMRLWRRRGTCWSAVGGPWRVRLGFAGLSARHHEGDGTTPEGAFAIGPVMYGVAPDPGVHFRYHQLVCGDWWDEDPASASYNLFQHVACGSQPPFGGASEALWRSSRAYAHFALIDYNVAPVVPGRGSAIFIHGDLGNATNGCVALPLPQLVALLRWLRPALDPLVVIGTAARIRGF